VQKPGHCKNRQCRKHDGGGVSPLPQTEVRGIIHHLHHEIFPVDVDAAPEIGKARRQVEEPVCLRQAEPEQVQHPDNQMELSGHPQIEQEVRNEVLGQLCRRRDIRLRYDHVLINEAVSNQMRYTADHPPNAALINLECILVVIRAAERCEVHHREKWKRDIG
jgi:hypothetical protein